ncbi:MAG: LPS export ABC transporter periplasmic protein LptC [Spirochaetaceae bacterium]
MQQSVRAIVVVLVSVFLVSCSLDYDAARLADSIPDTMPTARLADFSHTVVRRGRRVFAIEADAALRFDRQNEQQLENVRFQEFNAESEVISSGSAAFARFFSETENVELIGAIEFSTDVENAVVTADYLYWDREGDMLYGDPNEMVRVTRGDGTRLEGRGFEVDLRRRIIDFTGPVEGVFVEDDGAGE